MAALVVAVASVPARAEDTSDAFLARLRGVETAAAALSSLQFDPRSVSVASLARQFESPRAAVAWMRDNLTLDPYEGSLRGARGTLLTRGGNSLDRALLLGEVLADMGYEWRVAWGTLDDTQARRLAAEVAADGSLVGDTVPSGATGYDAAADGRVRGSLARHFWVRARARGAWTDYDPTFPGLDIGETATGLEAELDPGSLPDDLVRRVTIGVYFETNGSDGGVAVSHTAPVSDVAYRNLTLTFDHAGNGMVPVLDVPGEVRTGARIPLVGLERVWVQFVFALGSAESRVVRDVYVSSSSLDLVHVDDHVFSMVLLPGYVGTDYYHAVLSVLLGEYSARIAPLRAAIPAGVGADTVPADLAQASRDQVALALGITSLAFAHASDRLTVRVARSFGVRPYFDEPRILLAGAYRSGGAMEYQLDLRSDEVAARPLDGVAPAVVPALEAVRGRFDAALAGGVLSLTTGREATSVADIVGAATDAGASLVTVHPGTVSRLGSLPIGQEAMDRLRGDVNERGGIALAPNRPADGAMTGPYGWWRFSPGTGDLVGVTDYGAHDAATFVPDPFDDDGRPAGTRLVDATLELLEAVVAGAEAIARDSAFGDDIVCESACDIATMRRTVCSDERDRQVPRLSACLRGVTARDTGSFLPVGTSCSGHMQTFYCGAAAIEGFATGGLAFETGLTPGVPTPFVGATPYAWDACACGAAAPTSGATDEATAE